MVPHLLTIDMSSVGLLLSAIRPNAVNIILFCYLKKLFYDIIIASDGFIWSVLNCNELKTDGAKCGQSTS